MENISIYSILGITAFVLLILVTGGIIYLTAIGWRDRRRQENDRRLSR